MLKELMPAEEYRQWMIYFKLEPFGSYAENYRDARLNQTIISMLSKPDKLDDYLLFGNPFKTIRDPEEVAKCLKAGMAQFIKREEKHVS